MSSEQRATGAEISVRNIGGIDETTVAFEPGVTVLAGENATNRTSLLQSLMAVLGSDDVSMKADADKASVELRVDGETYTRTLTRQGSTIATGGDPYLADSTLADLFAFLLESNEARRRVATEGDLRELIMRPVDTEEIQREIDRLSERRNEIDDELSTLDSLKDRLPSLEERRTQLRGEIEETEAELADVEARLDERDADIEQTREEKAELEERLTELRTKRSELEDVRYDLETERESLESLQTQRREVESELESLPETPVGEIDDLEARISSRRERKATLESAVNEIQSAVRFNQEMLEGDEAAVSLPAEDDGDLTDELLPSETVTCWTCGSEVPQDRIEETVGRLRELSQSKLGDIDDIESEITELQQEVEDLRETQRRRETLQRQLSDHKADIERSETAIDRLTDRREALRSEISELEEEISELESDSYEEILDIHREANQLEYELGRLEGDLESIEDEIADIESRLDEESTLQEERDAVEAKLQELRTKIHRIEREAIDAFNEHMETVLGILGYENIERIWIERLEREVRKGRRTESEATFELHIVRQTDGGATYEDTIDHLSESEREVTGLIFALAGYLTHEVYETVPFMLLDSLEAIDSERIAALVEYIAGHSDYLVVALLPEDAAALPETYPRVTDI
ncbi:Smc-like protein Sph2 [Natronomonas pharaonis DSM 2160]|uniref:Smc-like protein Sph2 n=1 Tax=Natronomonas pharaonis (strain ATCC 35678 / DSM 2160 / CIP 103997 / JCM 8858 / NBRC 14720 / NCIMB 2260 / Gabara) TaxID=348780 RepID=Q3INT0_NATPD|nr:archaea-specific SMC-related protein [Natronomonas pharaonis]CAI50222.1 Smc-like protein Sph2 [Natronomonas pharaonis DSM 2160]